MLINLFEVADTKGINNIVEKTWRMRLFGELPEKYNIEGTEGEFVLAKDTIGLFGYLSY